MTNRSSLCTSGALALLFTCGLGCNEKPQAAYHTMHLINAGGTVTLDGQPLPNAVVTFENPEDGTFSFGMTNSSGGYSLRFDSEMMGVTAGKKLVRISTSRKIEGLNSNDEGGVERPADSSGERVPAKFNKESDYMVEVKAGQTRYNLDLKSN